MKCIFECAYLSECLYVIECDDGERNICGRKCEKCVYEKVCEIRKRKKERKK